GSTDLERCAVIPAVVDAMMPATVRVNPRTTPPHFGIGKRQRKRPVIERERGQANETLGTIKVDVGPVISVCMTSDLIIIGARPHQDVVTTFAPAGARVDLKRCEAQVFRRQFMPFGSEVFPIDADPEIVRIAAGTPNARKFGDAALLVDL